MDAAKREFSERRFAGMTLSAIARQAAVSQQLVQHHFGKKEALFRAVRRARFRPTLKWDAPFSLRHTSLLGAS